MAETLYIGRHWQAGSCLKLIIPFKQLLYAKLFGNPKYSMTNFIQNNKNMY